MDVLGNPPVSSLDDEILPPDVESCKLRLEEEVSTLLKKGYWFNTEYAVTLSPDETTKEIILGADVLLVTTRFTGQYIQRGTKMYDAGCNTYQFEDSIVADLVIDLEWDLLPFTVQDAAMHLAAVKICKVDLEDSRKAADLQLDANKALIALGTDELDVRQHNILGTRAAQHMKYRITPHRRSSYRNPNIPGG